MITNTVTQLTNPAPQEHVADLTAADPLFGDMPTDAVQGNTSFNRTIPPSETAQLPDPLSVPTAIENAVDNAVKNVLLGTQKAQEQAQTPGDGETPQPETESEQSATIPPELEAQYGKLDDYFQARFGIGLEDAFSAINQLTEFRNQSLVEQQQRQLQADWGIDSGEMNRRMEMIRDEFQSLTPEQQAAMDNPRGAQILWDAIEARQLRQQTSVNRPRPVFNRSQQKSSLTQDYDFKQSEIMAMIQNGTYDQQVERITQAYLNKRVKNDI